MSQEEQKDMGDSTENNEEGPDYFSFYTSQIAELLSKDVLLPFVTQPSQRKGLTLQENAARNSLFGNPLENGLTDFKKSRLETLLRQSVLSLSKEVDEMIDPVNSIHRIKRHLQYRKELSSTLTAEASQNGSLRNTYVEKEVAAKDAMPGNELGQVDDDLLFFIKKDSTKVEAVVSEYSDELSESLGSMIKKLEDLYEMVSSCCRPMTHNEKQQLVKLIQKLPTRNIDDIVGIIKCGKPTNSRQEHSCDEIIVELEKQDKSTLWRLYYYVKAVENAKKLSSMMPPAM